ncbi:MAG: PD-(D/E)XK nuclease family protein [Armatimonadetes bacterium]|nr:PD-(D/E)XK nuclease family protein [Anaerolineae bacterium]
MLRIHLAAVGAGKTEAALNALNAALQAKRFARVWVLLATRRQEDAFRQRLIERDDQRQLYVNVEFFTFYGLYRRLLHMAHQPAYGLSDDARTSLLRRQLYTLHATGKLPLFGGIAHTAGLPRVLLALIDELKQNQVNPTDFSGAAQTQKDRELAAIYDGYQTTLRTYDLVDIEGEGWLALERLTQQPSLGREVDLLVVDGYDQFTRVQARLLRQLATRAGDTLVTLTTVPGREATIGQRFERALQALIDGDATTPIDYRTVATPRHPDLQHLAETVFAPGANLRPVSGGVALIEAPDAAGEVSAVLRRIKALLLHPQTPCVPDDILVALRDWGAYYPHFAALAGEYQVPLALHYGAPLAENPVVAIMLKLLALPATDFPRRDLLDVLRSPYIHAPGLSAHAIALLEAISQRYSVIAGREQWAEAVRAAAQETLSDDGDILPPLLSEADADALEFQLTEFFEYLTPPDAAPAEVYVRWLENLLGDDPLDAPEDGDFVLGEAYHLGIIAAARTDDDATAARDLAALHTFKRALRGILGTHALLANLDDAVPDDMPLAWGNFYGELLIAVETASINPHPARGGRILVTTATDARGLPHDHLFILGLSEGVFPAPLAEDPLYLDSERTALRAHGVYLLTRAERASDEGLFYELLALPRSTLTLTRPAAQDGQPWNESHLWRAVQAVFTDLKVERLRAGEVVPAAQVASLNEAALAVADGLNSPQPDADTLALYDWLTAQHPAYWGQIRAGRDAEARRLDHHTPHDAYSGRLSDPGLIAHAAARLDERRLWSATQFNEFGTCAFRFFAHRLLKLETLEPPAEGMDALQAGSLNHKILETTYHAFAADGLPIAPMHAPHALDLLHSAAAHILTEAPERYGFRPTALWRQEQARLVERLTRLVTLDFSEDSPIAKHFPGAERRVYQTEAAFGRDAELWIELGDDAGRVRVNGSIDRIDRVGDALVVMDYKSGSTKFSTTEMREGRNFQMVVYLLAAESLLGASKARRVAGGLFWHLGKGEVSGVLRADQDAGEIIAAAREHLARYVVQMRAGDFAVQPSKPTGGQCSAHCEYRELCRLCGLVRKA